MRPLYVLISAAGLLLCVGLVGCKKPLDRPREREEVSGSVKWNNRPLKWGTISFEPMDDDPMGGTSADIADGQFTIPRERGPEAGAYRIRIFGSMNPNDNAELSGPHTDDATPKKMVPAIHNEKSTMTREVKRGGPNVFKFDLN